MLHLSAGSIVTIRGRSICNFMHVTVRLDRVDFRNLFFLRAFAVTECAY